MENQFYKISKQLIEVFKASTEGKKPTEKYNSIIYVAIDQLEELHISIYYQMSWRKLKDAYS